MVDKSISVKAAGLSHQGLVREQNEDQFVIDQSIGCYLIADGMGGHQAGEVASRIATNTISSNIARLNKRARSGPAKILESAIMAAHQAIRKESRRTISHQGMGSTVVIAWLPTLGNELWLANVGDSRAYLQHETAIICLTEDHTIYNQARRAGLLGPDPSTHPPRSMLSQALGASDVIAPDITRIDIQAGDILLLCSDGLTDMLKDEQILSLLLSGGALEELCQKLIQAALDNGGKDNVSVVLLQVQAQLV
jgi:serine/threonine protein phosphatase PrpC